MWKNRKSPIKYLACFYLINLPKGFCSSLRQPFSNATPKSPFDAICDFDFLRKSVFKEPGVIIQLLPHAALIIISNYSNPATDKGGGGFHCENAPLLRKHLLGSDLRCLHMSRSPPKSICQASQYMLIDYLTLIYSHIM